MLGLTKEKRDIGKQPMKRGITSTGQMANDDRVQIEVVTACVSVANIWTDAEFEWVAYGCSYEWFEKTDTAAHVDWLKECGICHRLLVFANNGLWHLSPLLNIYHLSERIFCPRCSQQNMSAWLCHGQKVCVNTKLYLSLNISFQIYE